MSTLPLAAYDWALRHLGTEGDTDLFPTPFEISAIKYSWKAVRSQFGALDVTNYVWRGGRRLVVPKNTLAFRIATQLDPIDSLVFAAIVYKHGPKLEASRIPITENRVFSYRLSPSKDGRLYSSTPSYHDFWNTSRYNAARTDCNYVVIADIADFYNQVYHHVVERQLESVLPAPIAKTIKKFLQTLSEKVSRGIPVGPHSSHILAECALDPTDRSILSHGYEFCRYVDDIHIFCTDEDHAMGALYQLAGILDSQQRLMLRNDKTRVISATDFIALADSMMIDRPANDEERRILKVISSETNDDPYRSISLSDLSDEDLEVLSDDVIGELLLHYIDQARVDFPRLGWLLRRLTQVGAPGGIETILTHLSKLSPILGPVARYLMSSIPNYMGDKIEVGRRLVAGVGLPVIKKSNYLQAVLLDILASLPELNSTDAITSIYAVSDPLVRREIIRAASSGGRGDWIRDRKNEFRTADPWSRRAYIEASSALPSEEADFWFQGVRDNLSSLEKVVAMYAFKSRKLKIGNWNITQE